VQIKDYRPIPFYFINTTKPQDLSLQAARTALEALQKAGFGGLIFFNKPPDGFSAEEYLGDFWFEVTENFLRAARERDLQFWVNDGFDFPPGDAAGRIAQRNPKLHQQYLYLEEDGRISIRKADWGFPAFEEKESSELFIELVYEEYQRRLGHYFSKGITGFFSDADNRRCNFQTQKILGSQQYFPWSRHFAAEFLLRFGYALEPELPALLAGKPTRARRDYWDLASSLYQQWFINNYQWCQKHGLKYTFHTSDTGPLSWQECQRSSVFSEGKSLQLFRHCDYPGTDHELLALDGGTHFDQRLFWPKVSYGGNDQKLKNPDFAVTTKDLRAKYAASAAFLHKKQRVLCEAFAASNWGADFASLRRIAAWQLLQGINFFVPHAVHHRLWGKTKYFAPPEFLHGSLQHGLNEFNDWLTHFCWLANQGEYQANLALLDPSEEIWKGKTDTNAFFTLCDQLNRQAIGYVIADTEQAKNFPYCVDAFAPEKATLPKPLAQVDSEVLAFMPRRLPDASEFLLVGNIWGKTRWQGNIHFANQDFSLELYPGELAVLGGPWEKYRKTVENPVLHKFPESLPIQWEEDNRIPIRQNCSWMNTADMTGMSILLPAALKTSARYDQLPLQDGEPIQVFDDQYYRYPVAGTAGKHELTLTQPCEFSEPLYLCGPFSLELQAQQEYHRVCFQYYHLQLHEPESLSLQLSPRKNILKIGSWADQGAPFYSNAVTYLLEADLQASNVRLILPAVAGVCEVFWQGTSLGRRIWPPYHFDLGPWNGKQQLQLRICNTLANQLDAYRAPAGLLQTPFLSKL